MMVDAMLKYQKEEFIEIYWDAIKAEINQTIIDYKHDVNIHQEDIVLFALTGEIMIPKLVELGILTEREAGIRKKIPTFEELYKTYQDEVILKSNVRNNSRC